MALVALIALVAFIALVVANSTGGFHSSGSSVSPKTLVTPVLRTPSRKFVTQSSPRKKRSLISLSFSGCGWQLVWGPWVGSTATVAADLS